MPLKAAEILGHPAYKHLEWKLSPTEADFCSVGNGRSGGPFKLWYEVHGTGLKRIVVSPVVSCSQISFVSICFRIPNID